MYHTHTVVFAGVELALQACPAAFLATHTPLELQLFELRGFISFLDWERCNRTFGISSPISDFEMR